MATTKITNPELFDLASLNTALQLPSGTTAQRPTSPSTGEWRYNTTTNLVEFWDGGAWRDLQSEDIPPIPSEHFNTVLYTGTGSAQSITGVGFKPDFVWIKERSAADNHTVFDSTRGVQKQLYPNLTNAESTSAASLTSFDTDGFTLGNSTALNESGQTYVAWCWKANAGTTSSNSDGSITSTVQANPAAGFSIVTWTGDGNVSTVGHGLSQVPQMIITKGRANLATYNRWSTYNHNLAANHLLYLDLTDGSANAGANKYFADSSFSNTVFGVGDDQYGPNVNGTTMVAYCFAEVAGYSKFGTYTGNGSTNGPIVETGFEPAFLMTKQTNTTSNWVIVDNKRSTTNPRDKGLRPNTSESESTVANNMVVDFLTNGFQLKQTSGANDNGGTFIYMAFAADQSAAPTLADSYATNLYTGNGTTQSITGLGFSPSLVWLKQRSGTQDNMWYDSNRGPGNYISSNTTGAQGYANTTLTSFDSDGFSVGSSNSENQNGQTFVAWNWKANTTPTINTDGTIQSVVSANQAAGFSIVKWTGDGNASSTVGHGLSGTPDFIMLKDLTDVGNWNGAQVGLASNEGIGINSSAGAFTGMGSNGGITYANLSATNFGFATGSSGVDSVNKNGNGYVAYCWKSVAGFSKMESYIGNGGSQSITTGFSPDWLMFKRTDQNGWYWEIADTARGVGVDLAANTSNAEQNQAPANRIQIDANGFTHLTGNYHNISGAKYIYMAYKENPAQYPIPSGEVGYLVVAGGGGGAVTGGAGGAGGLRTTYGTTSGGGSSAESNITLSAQTYTITVGAGGAGLTSGPADGNAGSNSVFGSITSIGGGKGTNSGAGGTGGSGGTGRGSAAGGSGTANQGFNGGLGFGSWTSGGGGGAGQVGQNAPADEQGGDGGNGLNITITGSNAGYAGGGGGAGGTSLGSGGAGGGGNGGKSSVPATSGTTNTGSGGGAQTNGGSTISGAGGSGIVVLRMNTSDYSGTTTGSPTVTTVGTETVLTYTGSGTYVHS